MTSSKATWRSLVAIALLGCLAAAPSSGTEWQADLDDKAQVRAQAAISRIKEKIPGSASYFEEAYGFAILSSVTRFAVGFGGAYGKGLVIEDGSLIGKTGFWQLSTGIQGGVNYFSMIVFFKDKEALEKFKAREIQFMGQAGVAVANVGFAGTPAFNDGVAIFTATRLGLMFEFSAAGAKFTYKPLP